MRRLRIAAKTPRVIMNRQLNTLLLASTKRQIITHNARKVSRHPQSSTLMKRPSHTTRSTDISNRFGCRLVLEFQVSTPMQSGNQPVPMQTRIMRTHILRNPVWHEPAVSLLDLSGERLHIIAADGRKHEALILVHPSKDTPAKFCVKIIKNGTRFLTAEGVRMIQPTGRVKGPGLVLSFAASRRSA